MGRRINQNRNDAGSLLASVFIIALGSGCCLFLVAAMSPSQFGNAAAVLGCVFGMFLFLIVLQRFGKIPKGNLTFLLSSSRNRRDDGLREYEPKIIGSSPSNIVTGTNQPISAKDAHDIQVTSANTWVPAKSRRSRKK